MSEFEKLVAELSDNANTYTMVYSEPVRAVIESWRELVASLEPFVSNHPITQFDFIAYREAAKKALAKVKS